MIDYKNAHADSQANREAEIIVMDTFRKRGRKITDLTGDYKKYGKMGDFCLKDKNGVTRYFDVKADRNICKTGNVLAEIAIRWQHNNTTHTGWYISCAYDYLCVYDPIYYTIYIIDVAKMRKTWIDLNCRHICKKWKQDDKIVQSDLICLIPLQKIKEYGCLVAHWMVML